ncbi:TPA: Glu-tRNA(Gln) amidotransferase GatDE subunit D, partial [Candidatus Bathyarchaeota archaeon]|nr:Glu-tRNA(Gln) amidotransferase GatDE subunit D [Candidatus Bathyarchaeota archaeon]
ASGPFAEVVVAMHASTSDERVAIHRGTRVRKCHTSRRDAFRSINVDPIAYVTGDRIEMTTEDYRRRDKGRALSLRAKFDERVAIVKFYPGFNPEIIDWYRQGGYRGLVLEGTGLGHVSRYCFPFIERAIDEGVIVVMTSQCIWGRVNMNVYETGRDLLSLGVIPLADMLSETALVKLMWALGQAKGPEEAKRLLLTDIAFELCPRTPY